MQFVARFQDMSFIPDKDPIDECKGAGVTAWFPYDPRDNLFNYVFEFLHDSEKLDEFYDLVPDEQRTFVLNLLKDEGVILKMTTQTQLDKLVSQAGPLQNPAFYNIFEEGTSPTIKFTIVFYHKNGQLQFAGQDWKYVPYAPGVTARYLHEQDRQMIEDFKNVM